MDVDEDEFEGPIVGTVTETINEAKRPKRSQSAHTPVEATGEVLGRPNPMGETELEMEDWEIAPGRMKDSSSDSKFTLLISLP